MSESGVVPAIINGQQLSGDLLFDDIDPSTGRPFAEIARCGANEVDLAVNAARDTFERSWRRTTASERARLLLALAALIRRDRDELAQLESRDTGKPLRQARVDVEVAARYFEYYAHTAEAVFG